MISLLEQQRVACIGAVKTESCPETPVHEDPRIGQVFGAIMTFAVNIDEKVA